MQTLESAEHATMAVSSVNMIYVGPSSYRASGVDSKLWGNNKSLETEQFRMSIYNNIMLFTNSIIKAARKKTTKQHHWKKYYN